MSYAIHKFTLTLFKGLRGNTISIPEGAKFLSVQNQRDHVCLWFAVDTTKPKVARRFFALETGFELEVETGEYLGTIQLNGGAYVVHIFEVEET